MHGQLRIAVRTTEDGLGIYIPPARRSGPTAFLSFWFCGWAAGEYFALGELLGGGFRITNLFLNIWVVPWSLAGAAVAWVLAWQLFGTERLYFTADTLVREWSILGFGRSRMLAGSQIVSVKVDKSASHDLAGIGTIKVLTDGKTMRIGAGLEKHEAELVAALIEAAAGSSGSAHVPSSGGI